MYIISFFETIKSFCRFECRKSKNLIFKPRIIGKSSNFPHINRNSESTHEFKNLKTPKLKCKCWPNVKLRKVVTRPHGSFRVIFSLFHFVFITYKFSSQNVCQYYFVEYTIIHNENTFGFRSKWVTSATCDSVRVMCSVSGPVTGVISTAEIVRRHSYMHVTPQCVICTAEIIC